MTLLFLVSIRYGKAQDLISVSYNKQTLVEIFNDLGNRASISIYYKNQDISDDVVTAHIIDLDLEQALQEVLKNTNLGFVRYRDHAVVIMPRLVASRVYSASFYQAIEQSRGTQEIDEESQDLVVGSSESLRPDGKAMISGTIVQASNGEPIIGATVVFPDLDDGTISDENGDFELVAPVGTYDILVKYVGYDDLFTKVIIRGDGELELVMRTEYVDLDAVTVTAQGAANNVEGIQIGVATLDVKNIERLPSLLGEADVIRNLLLNPGVSSLGEGATGFNVRGGNVDQNLVMIDEGFLFNSSHALGFFSTYNADLINTVNLYKGNMPAQYGGRLASALDVQMKSGDREKYRLAASVGPVTSKVSLEGPLVSDKVSIVIGGRSSYANWLLDRIKLLEVQRSRAFFYDVNAKVTIRPSELSTIALVAYASDDDFSYNQEFGFDYGTKMGQLIYRQIFSDKTYNKLSVVRSRYVSSQTDFAGSTGAIVSNNLNYFKIKEQFTYNPGNQLKLDLGFSGTLYEVEPSSQVPFGDESEIVAMETEADRGLEAAAFVNAEVSITRALSVSAGVRAVFFNYLGPNHVYQYENPDNITAETITGVTSHGEGKTIASYHSLEPRLSLRLRLSPHTSIKSGYSRTAQFINQIFNSDSPTPNSQWQLSTNYIEPFRSHNVSIGLFKNSSDNLWETSIEFYGRNIDHLYDYRDFAKLLVSAHLETELLPGIGKSYGAELSIKKKEGPINGWLSYTYSRSERQILGINEGAWYPSNFDKPHNGSLILNFQPNRRNTLTINFNYSTGRPTTPPIGNFLTQSGLVVPIYSVRNQYRVPDYHRLDIAYTLGKGYKRDKRVQTSWTLSIYNAYSRRNAFSVYFTRGAFRRVQANRLAILGTAIPSLTLNLEIL